MATVFVSPAGKASETGLNREHPTSLYAALSGSHTPDAKTVEFCLLPGRYHGSFHAALNGDPDKPYRIYADIPGSVILDPFVELSLAAPIPESSSLVRYDIILNGHLDHPQYSALLLLGADPGDPRQNESVELGQPQHQPDGTTKYVGSLRGDPAMAYPAGTKCVLRGDILRIIGSNLIIEGIWFDYSGQQSRVFNYAVEAHEGKASHRPPGGIYIGKSNVTLRNCNVSNLGYGVVVNGNAKNVTLSGLVTYNNGLLDRVRGEGHGLYLQNNTETPLLVNNVMSFHNFATGAKGYGEQGYANDIHFNGYIGFENGESATYPESPALEVNGGAGNVYPNSRNPNLLIGTAVHGLKRDSIVNSVSYNRSGTTGAGSSMPHAAGTSC